MIEQHKNVLHVVYIHTRTSFFMPFGSNKHSQKNWKKCQVSWVRLVISANKPHQWTSYKFSTRASRWRAIAYPRARVIAYLRAHQNSKCVPPVLIHRAITCDSFKVLAQKAWEELFDNKYKSHFWPLVTPRHAPGAKFLHRCILLFITFDLICNMTMFVQNGFWTLRGPTPGLAPRG